MIATKNNQPADMLRLIAKGADVNAKENGIPVLHYATNHAYSNSVQLLVEHGADVNQQNFRGVTKLMLVASYGDFELVEYLLEHGANPCIRDNTGKCAMDYARESMTYYEDSNTINQYIKVIKTIEKRKDVFYEKEIVQV